eukprot:gnl/TRDRNA2_/TRDRNA2_128060_c0_seq1.p1 gnl/TRDRNA2_/TRDRNA2_128060_c0~~gnl/TRDRNA2_/TRDRNA2_128060_c0_seq1.p1  ORF type:complete len:417 (+),score=52.40 gnl/TRDRNA2_/TRDRNA2_128060_c0_seq1:491-1741(+)
MGFEAWFGLELRNTNAVKAITQEFIIRLGRLLEELGKVMKQGADLAIDDKQFFKPDNAADECSSVSGFVGFTSRIFSGEGNLRETWGTLYCITKLRGTRSLNVALGQISEEAFEQVAKRAQFGPCASAHFSARKQIADRFNAFKAEGLGDFSPQNLAHFIFPSHESWVRFTFPGPDWKAARTWRGACERRSLTIRMARHLEPPLSEEEERRLMAICRQESEKAQGSSREDEKELRQEERQPSAVADKSCQVSWYPGEGCYTLATDDNPFIEISKRLGWRIVAGPSGTTADVMTIAGYLGFKGYDFVMLRLAMLAWMLPAQDHSLFEILLAADPYMAGRKDYLQSLDIKFDDKELSRIWPQDLSYVPDWAGGFTFNESLTVNDAIQAAYFNMRSRTIQKLYGRGRRTKSRRVRDSES